MRGSMFSSVLDDRKCPFCGRTIFVFVPSESKESTLFRCSCGVGFCGDERETRVGEDSFVWFPVPEGCLLVRMEAEA